MTSKIIESLRDDLAALHEAGAISKVTMREFDVLCPPPVRESSADDIKRFRERLKFSQPVFAHHLRTTASTVRKWEQGEVQSYLRESVRVICAATDIAGGVENAIYWFKNNPLPVFDYKTPQDLVSEGRTEALVQYIQSLRAGFVG